MSWTRYSQQPLQIYQDPVPSFDHAPMPSVQNPTNPKKLSHLLPINDTASRKNVVFNPPQTRGLKHPSPLKPAQQTSISPSRAPFSNKLNMISMPPPGGPTYNTDSIEKKQPLMSKFKPQKALFNTFTGSNIMGKENYPETSYAQSSSSYSSGLSGTNFSLEGLYGQKPPPMRTLLDAAPIHESRLFAKPKVEEESEADEAAEELPAPDSFPPLQDDGAKPSHSYAQLIGMSILRAPNRRLTLAQIYKWISDTYSFYNASDSGWQNSIRHNLSLNKAFIKQERPKDDPGKGNYWTIQPGMEQQFIKDKSTRKTAGPNENPPLLSTNLTAVNQPESAQFKPLTPATQELPPQSTNTVSAESQLPAIPELSSDATIPASDAFNPEPELEVEAEELPPSSPLIPSSPPAPMMRSSPPVARHAPRRNDTPPPVPRFPSSSRTRSHKRKFTSMDDSGYFSSLDSSAMRPQGVGRLLTSEADRPRIKRGRAEEEIARIRASSYDSPTKGRVMYGFAPPSSSPLRRGQKYDSNMLPPLTPIVKLKPPMRPPPTVSPNTNLRLHRDKVREMVGSPVRGMTCLDENIPWSPAFNLDETNYLLQDFSTDFDIFTNTNLGQCSVPGYDSPEKRSAKRPRLNQSRSANILADISNNFNKSITSTPILKFTPSLEPTNYDSPLKRLGMIESPSKLLGTESPTKMPSPFSLTAFNLPQEEEFYGAEFLSEEATDFSGMDIMQGFQKIGASGQSSRGKTNSSQSAFGWSLTGRF